MDISARHMNLNRSRSLASRAPLCDLRGALAEDSYRSGAITPFLTVPR